MNTLTRRGPVNAVVRVIQLIAMPSTLQDTIRSLQIHARVLVGLITAVAFICVILIRYGTNSADFRLILAWGVGCIVGIAVSSRFTSIIVGAMLGGGLLPVISHFVCALLDVPGAAYTPQEFWLLWLYASILSATLALMLGLVVQKFRIGRPFE